MRNQAVFGRKERVAQEPQNLEDEPVGECLPFTEQHFGEVPVTAEVSGLKPVACPSQVPCFTSLGLFVIGFYKHPELLSSVNTIWCLHTA